MTEGEVKPDTVAPVEIDSKLMPKTIELSEIHKNILQEMFTDLGQSLQKSSQLEAAKRQIEMAYMQSQNEGQGQAKAIDSFIKAIVREHEAIGSYKYDLEKKILVLSSNGK
jgi:hypothetical protein